MVASGGCYSGTSRRDYSTPRLLEATDHSVALSGMLSESALRSPLYAQRSTPATCLIRSLKLPSSPPSRNRNARTPHPLKDEASWTSACGLCDVSASGKLAGSRPATYARPTSPLHWPSDISVAPVGALSEIRARSSLLRSSRKGARGGAEPRCPQHLESHRRKSSPVFHGRTARRPFVFGEHSASTPPPVRASARSRAPARGKDMSHTARMRRPRR